MWNAGRNLAKRYCFQTFSALNVSKSLFLLRYPTVPPEFHIRLKIALRAYFDPPSPREKVRAFGARSPIN
jgi:hypothetical protein